MTNGGEGVDDVAELEHHRRLEAWAEGVYPVDAATRLLIRSGFAQTGRPWIRTVPGQGSGHWVDVELIAAALGGGGERRLLLIAASLGAVTLVDLSDALSTLDRGAVSLVLVAAVAAVAHAAGTTTGTHVLIGEDDRPRFVQPGSLYPWPGDPE